MKKTHPRTLRPTSLRQGRYCLIAELSTGSTATLYLAASESPIGFDKIHVIKCLKRDLADEPELSTMFVDEARLAARLEHPNVVRTIEVCVDSGEPAIVMEYVEGCSLHELAHAARSGNARVERAHWLAIIAEILAGLDYAHNLRDFDGTPLRVVHRDVSPGNVLISSCGEVKLADFGIAKAALRCGSTAVGTIKGKMRYMAPEQIQGDPVDARADLFAVGVILWELLAGRPLWKGPMPGARGPAMPLSDALPDAPPELDAICRRALAEDPSERYPSAAHMLQALEHYLSRDERHVNRVEIGRVVREAFGARLAQCQSIVREQLAKLLASSSSTPWSLMRVPDMSDSIAPEPTSVSLRPAAPPPTSSRSWIYGIVLVLCMTGAGLFFYTQRGELAPEPVSAPAGTVTFASSDAPSPAVSQIEVYVVATPPEAAIYIDGRRMPANPHRGYVGKDADRHTVRVEAPNHIAVERDVRYDDDVVLRLRLDPTPIKRPPAKPSPPDPIPSASPWDP